MVVGEGERAAQLCCLLPLGAASHRLAGMLSLVDMSCQDCRPLRPVPAATYLLPHTCFGLDAGALALARNLGAALLRQAPVAVGVVLGGAHRDALLGASGRRAEGRVIRLDCGGLGCGGGRATRGFWSAQPGGRQTDFAHTGLSASHFTWLRVPTLLPAPPARPLPHLTCLCRGTRPRTRSPPRTPPPHTGWGRCYSCSSTRARTRGCTCPEGRAPDHPAPLQQRGNRAMLGADACVVLREPAIHGPGHSCAAAHNAAGALLPAPEPGPLLPAPRR